MRFEIDGHEIEARDEAEALDVLYEYLTTGEPIAGIREVGSNNP